MVNRQAREPYDARPAALQPRNRDLLLYAALGIGFVVALGAMIAYAVARSEAVYAEFMDGCERDHKHYECMLLWRASRRDDPTIIPIPIPIPR